MQVPWKEAKSTKKTRQSSGRHGASRLHDNRHTPRPAAVTS